MFDIEEIRDPGFLKQLKDKELDELAQAIRSFLIEQLSKTGGHLGANLGVVELTIALHYVLDSPMDKLIWDVGHQSYVHKILTGRAQEFSTLRKFEGLSGFQKRHENKHDIWESGHSSTSISAGVGLAIARDLQGETHQIVPIIGDGALTGGMAFEALNHLGELQKKMMIVLNDNGMSISKNTGALQKTLELTSSSPNQTNLLAASFFESVGIRYLGPVDGHNTAELIGLFTEASKINGPVIVHVKTKKGKGYLPAEQDKLTHFHGIEPYDMETGLQYGKKSTEKVLSWSEVISGKLINLAATIEDFAVLTPAMVSGSKLEEFQAQFPNRLFDTAIAEQHTVTLSGGLAIGKIMPIVAIYSTFLQRAYDQLIHDICRQNLPVILCIDRAGFVGADGDTHHGIFDIAFLRAIPNMTLIMPASKEQCEAILENIIKNREITGPVGIRFPRGEAVTEAELEALGSLPVSAGRQSYSWLLRKPGKDLLILTFGPQVEQALRVSQSLASDVSVGVIDVQNLKPIEQDLLIYIQKENLPVLTLEEGVISGGFGSGLLEVLTKNHFIQDTFIECMGIEDRFIEHGSIDELRADAKLADEDIKIKIKAIITRKGGA